jgi:hypothetical protein
MKSFPIARQKMSRVPKKSKRQTPATRRRSEVSLPERVTGLILERLVVEAQDSRARPEGRLTPGAIRNVCVFFPTAGVMKVERE